MSLETQIAICTEHYNMWKDKALFTNDICQARKALERAFFWLELRSALLFLLVVEKTKGNNQETKRKLIEAKINLSKKLTDYLKEMINELA
ncbi:MAG: hypothetical protein QW818_02935 [Candidatus Aenigmatarchaeota archaeon]|nr:hypothetical protein [Candidatus Aenigmarchaeota archaeon]